MSQVTPKKKKYSNAFKSAWIETFDCITASTSSKYHGFCKLCRVDFSVEYGGKADCTRHTKSDKHKKNVESQKATSNMSTFIFRGVTEADQIINAEVRMSMLIALSTASLSLSEEFNKTVKLMFPDSTIAKKYSCGKTWFGGHAP